MNNRDINEILENFNRDLIIYRFFDEKTSINEVSDKKKLDYYKSNLNFKYFLAYEEKILSMVLTFFSEKEDNNLALDKKECYYKEVQKSEFSNFIYKNDCKSKIDVKKLEEEKKFYLFMKLFNLRKSSLFLLNKLKISDNKLITSINSNNFKTYDNYELDIEYVNLIISYIENNDNLILKESILIENEYEMFSEFYSIESGIYHMIIGEGEYRYNESKFSDKIKEYIYHNIINNLNKNNEHSIDKTKEINKKIFSYFKLINHYKNTLNNISNRNFLIMNFFDNIDNLKFKSLPLDKKFFIYHTYIYSIIFLQENVNYKNEFENLYNKNLDFLSNEKLDLVYSKLKLTDIIRIKKNNNILGNILCIFDYLFLEIDYTKLKEAHELYNAGHKNTIKKYQMLIENLLNDDNIYRLFKL